MGIYLLLLCLLDIISIYLEKMEIIERVQNKRFRFSTIQRVKQTVCQAISIIVKHCLFYTLILPILSFLFQNVIFSFLYLGTLPNEFIRIILLASLIS